MYKDITMTEKIVTSVNPAAKVWLVTGCSTGFGRVLVPAILARGDNVIGTARRIVDLDYIKSLKGARALQLDVTAHEDIIQAKIKEAVKYFGRVDILVNNAGYVLSGVWEEVK
jgi:NADP-dependent 3-hydroxy acid dehydrogenase YdfG